MRTRFFAAVLILLGCPIVAAAQTHVVTPNIYTNAEGPGSSNILIGQQNNPWTVQFLLSSTQLSGLVNHNLTGITYRLSNLIPGPYPLVTTTWADYQIHLGASVAPTAGVTTFADNYLTGSTLVRSGPLTVPPLAWPQGSPPAPSPWGIQINFSTPYLYTGGNLALLVTHPGSNNPEQGNSLLDASASSSPGLHTDYRGFVASSYNATSGNQTNFVTVVRFTGVAASVPEPTTLVLCGLAVAAAGGACWEVRRRRKMLFNQSSEPHDLPDLN